MSRSLYDNNPNNVQVGELLPPNCQQTTAGCSGNATNDGSYPFVWNNNLVDGSFGITSKIFLDQYTPTGALVNSLVYGFPRQIYEEQNCLSSHSGFPSVSYLLSHTQYANSPEPAEVRKGCDQERHDFDAGWGKAGV